MTPTRGQVARNRLQLPRNDLVATAQTARVYKRAARKVILAAVLGLVFSVFAMHNAGYAVFIGGGVTGETKGSLVLLNCRYFTGTEKVINHSWRGADGGKPSCPLVAKFEPQDIGALPLTTPLN